jgi:hypothetical protein
MLAKMLEDFRKVLQGEYTNIERRMWIYSLNGTIEPFMKKLIYTMIARVTL